MGKTDSSGRGARAGEAPWWQHLGRLRRTRMKKGFLTSNKPAARKARAAEDTSNVPAAPNPDGKECCYVKCKAYNHKFWFYRGDGPNGDGPNRVWVGSEHRCVYIPFRGPSSWTFHRPAGGVAEPPSLTH